MFFFKKKEENLPETSLERLKRLDSKVVRLEAEVLELYTAIDIIRNKVLRKIQFKKEPEKEEKDKDLYSGVLLKPPYGNIDGLGD